MMKKALIPVALAATLTGCVTAGEINSVITQVQNVTVQVCGFLPAAESVAAVLGTMFGGAAGGVIVGDIEQVASAICNSATAAPMPKSLRGRTARQITVRVNGVPVKGHFTR